MSWEENEKKKEYLSGYRTALRREKRILEQIQQLRLDAMLPSCIQGDGMPGGSGREGDLSDYAEKLDELMELLEQERLEAVRQYQEIYQAVKRIQDDEEREILTRRYLKRESWEAIAKEMMCSRRTAIRIHGRALKNFQIPKSWHTVTHHNVII